jgi:uncharacterized protein (DUF697 family)
MTQNDQKTAEEVLSDEIHTQTDGNQNIDFRHQLAHQSVKNWSQWATVAGFIPVPFVDTAAITALQIKMINDLCKIYKVEFKKELVVSIIASLAGASVATMFSTTLGSTFARYIPVVGTTISAITQPALSYASTYAIGVTFVKHFENKGSLIDFDVASTKGFFNDQIAKAKKIFQKKNTRSEEAVVVDAVVVDAV